MFTATYKKRKTWYLGWVNEIPGVNTQGKTLKETKENLKDALALIIETNRNTKRTWGTHKLRGAGITESISVSA